LTIDTHQHFWNLRREPMTWMTSEHSAIARDFEPADLLPLLDACEIDRTVLVQSACTDSDTDAMFAHAKENPWICAVTAWVDLLSPPKAEARLDVLAGRPALRGIRHLIHEEVDPHWILRERVLESLRGVAGRGLLLELPCVFPRHLGDLPELAQRFPRLTIVIDHLGKPPLGTALMGEWAAALRRAAEFPNVCAKVSGLNTMLATPGWGSSDLRPAVEVAVESFGADRLMCGSDWPVCLLNGDYGQVWPQTVAAITEVAGDADARRILEDTPARLYGLSEAPSAMSTSTTGEAHGRPY
jgi:L-fucono-1,5-lactonase